MPENLKVDHVWLDQSGRVRLLDHIVVSKRCESKPARKSVADCDSTSPAEVILELLERFQAHHAYPVHVLTLREEIYARRHEPGVMQWTANQLTEMADRPSSWRWDDRLGMIAMSISIELSVFSVTMIVFGLLALTLQLEMFGAFLLLFFCGAVVAGLAGYVFHGGIAAYLSGVSIRLNGDRTAASRIKCGLRSIMAWIPWITLTSAGISFLLNQIQNDPLSLEHGIENAPLFPAVVGGILVSFSVMAVGILAAILFPPRGIPDFLCGTRLMRK
jgi:hypothetical protein